eukprot:364948-Chlamydomonas_euryale.AAC.9
MAQHPRICRTWATSRPATHTERLPKLLCRSTAIQPKILRTWATSRPATHTERLLKGLCRSNAIQPRVLRTWAISHPGTHTERVTPAASAQVAAMAMLCGATLAPASAGSAGAPTAAAAVHPHSFRCQQVARGSAMAPGSGPVTMPVEPCAASGVPCPWRDAHRPPTGSCLASSSASSALLAAFPRHDIE